METIGISGSPMEESSYSISEKDATSEFQLKAFKYLMPLKNCQIESKESLLVPFNERNVNYLPYAKSYIDDSVAKVIGMVQGRVTDQLRSVSVVFLKFGGFQSETVAEARNLKQLQDASLLIMRKVHEFEGCIRQFNCDDKSLTALLVWGLEGQAHEKGESYVAMLAATEIAKQIPNCLEDKLGFSIGVTTGTVFAGIVGSKERCDNTVLGVVVNNAARLMCLDQCLGTVLCDHETYLKTVSHFQYVTDIPPVTLKGVPHPVKIYNPMGDNVSVRSHAHISVCGREKELETMSNSLHMWRSSQHAKSIILLGSSGIGKTQITSWLQDQIEETEVLCVGLALEHKKETLLFCWMRVFHSFLDQVCGNVDAMSKLETKHGGDIGKRKDDNSTEGSTDNNESESPTTNKFLAEPVVQRRPGSGRSDVRSDIWYNPYRSGLNVNFAMMSKDVTPKKPSVYEDIQVTQQETTILNEEGKPSTSVSLPLSVRTHNSPTSANFSTTTPVSMSPPGASSDQNVAKNSDENDDNVETSLTKHKFTSEIAVRPPRPWSGRSERGNIATMRQDRIHESAANSDSLSKVVNFKNSSNLAKYSNSPPTLSLESVHASPGHSRDNLHSEKEKSSAAFLRTLQPWSGKSSSRNSYTLRQSPNMIQRGLTAIECGESGHSLNPGLQSKARSDEDLRNSNKGILKGQSDSPRPRSRHSGLGVRLFTSEGRTPSRLLERMSISNVSETTSSNKDKLPKLLRILTTLNIPLSCIETLNPITGFSTSQSFVNGISSVAEVLSEILNAVCDVGVRICVTLDDIQWCDSYSLELAKNLIHKCPKVLFVFTARPLQEWRPTSGELLKKILQEDIHTIEVKPMDSRGVEQMCKSRLSPLMDFHSISEEMVREILNRGQGNPMVTGILISTLIEERMISVKDGVIVAMGLKDLQLAFGSAAAVIAQFDKLSAQMKCLLRVFAISGQYFKLDEVSAALFLFHSSVEETGVQPAPSAILALLRAEDKYNFIKHTDDENEMCFSHYLIQQAIISSMVPSMRENIRKVFIQFYESALLHSEGAARASYRQSLIFFLRKISGEEQKKKVHIYEAFLECGEMNQSMEALEYYEMLSELTKDMDVADTFLKKVREYRVLARIYFERGEYEKALTLGRNSLAVLGCKPSLVNPSLLTLVGNVYSLVKKTISILNLRSDQAIKAAASVLLIETFPNAELFSATSQKSCKYMRPMTEEEQDKLFQEIISIVIIMNHVYEQTKPGLEMLMLSLLITAPSLLAQESRTYRICFYFSTLATITKIFGFLQLSAVAKQNASGMFEMLSSNDMEHHMTLYESFMYANTFEVLAVESVLESDIFTAAFNYRKAFTLTIRQGLGMSDKSFLFAEFARLHMQTSGYDDEIVENWFDRNERRHYGKGAKPFFLAEGAISVANSLARLNDLDRALSLYEEGMKHFVACHETFNDVLRLLQFHVNVIRIKVCASRMKRDSSDIAENMKAIEMCMKNAPLFLHFRAGYNSCSSCLSTP
ncbi:hypothetical protein BC830DRAFT_804356 [Chytriomyces sp. MP71]|nr:hypothetical protein BC830DRAFT_804356 [Chytriomyces sp. MP71]